MADELAAALGMEPEDEANLAEALEAEPPGEAGEESDAEVEVAALDAVAAAADAPAVPIWESAAVFADAAVIDSKGFVSCPLPPWNALPIIGRITVFPDHGPLEKRNVSCKCKVHTGCSSPAKKRGGYTDREFLIWLFAGTCEPLCVRGRSEELAKEHTRAWALVLDGHRKAERAAALAAI